MRFKFVFLPLLLLLGLFFSCKGKGSATEEKQIAVFVPGQLEGNPTYEMMDRGVRDAAQKYGAAVLTVQGGFNQGEWEQKVLTLAAEARYDLIVTSNPSMTEICQRIGEEYPNQLFLSLDGTDIQSENLVSVVYNHMEQAYMAGHLAALITGSEMKGANPDLKVGLISAQLYPDMENSILPGFTVGFKSIYPQGEVDFRVLGNWYDASKASEMARSMFDSGVDVILPIAGGANLGVISAAKESDNYLIWFDSPGTQLEPGVVLASSLVNQEEIAFDMIQRFLQGDLEGGTVMKGGVRAGYVQFDEKDSLYQKYVPQAIRDKQSRIIKDLEEGSLTLKPFS